MTDQRAELKEFLRSRRARISPEEAGLARRAGFSGRRRVPGLRREELAQLAGMSIDYYVRLEQGRGGQASPEVLDALAHALQLDEFERAHLYALVRGEDVRASAGAGLQEVRAGVRALLEALGHVPAYVVGRRLEVLAWNELARVLIADFPELPEEQRNLGRLTFLDTSARQRYLRWQEKAQDTVAFLRFDLGRHPDDARLAALIEELRTGSEDFRRMWSEHDVRDVTYGPKPLYHPLVGTLKVMFETLRLPDDPDQAVVAYLPEPGTSAAAGLALLATKSAGPE
ncbi:helix-turn-helix transcriptional regulator [Streptomyces pinistramenti]|uniref:helix-turn-helix transcriptional regulator n=1 Tax=Streptomyces pinistramenti TaxID=2884812 RepID=UPI001D061257|nr:helix-turn-helix transcriptional regulator [Streptomyces pinistramenti]MCB5906404.1 helix-turn-helix transcriptional regulator [Streptomyces pinistramenti]